MNEHLAVDIEATMTIDVETWADIAMGFDLNLAVETKFKSTLWTRIEKLFEEYSSKTEGNPGNEPTLYAPFVELLNALADLEKLNDDGKVFYVQHPAYVRGAYVEEAFDIGAVFKKLAGKNERIAKGMFWGLLLFIIEMKHRKGAKLDFVSYKGECSFICSVVV